MLINSSSVQFKHPVSKTNRPMR